jgi:hypothetical protein
VESAEMRNMSGALFCVVVIVGAVAPWLLPAAAFAQDGGIDDLRARVERLERENDQLRQDLDGLRRLPEVEAPRPATDGPILPIANRRFEELDPDPPEVATKDVLDKELSPFAGLKGVKVGMLAYLDYSFGEQPEFNFGQTGYNLFSITRGYLNVEKQITPWFYARVTPDVYQDSAGNWDLRLKYYYAELRPQDFAFLTGMKSELGLGHMPWLDFEEHVNPYRCQGTMPIERAGVFNSSDLGVSLRGDLGGKLEDAEAWVGSTHYDGRYGSWHLGVYNGAGYHAVEHNGNKPFEGRFTLRPLPDTLPGLQLSYFGLVGLGNAVYAAGSPDYNVNMTMVSYQRPWLVLVGEYFTTTGNAAGTWVDPQGRSLSTEGYSVFANLRLPTRAKRLWLFSRYDHFNQDVGAKVAGNADYDMYIGGLAYYIYKENLVMLVFETTDYGSGANKKGSAPDPTKTNLGTDQKGQLVFQISF